VRGDPAFVKDQCNKSLERFGIDTIDLFFQHCVDVNVPIEDTVGAMAELVKEGKVRYLGLDECSVDTLRRAHKVHPSNVVPLASCPHSFRGFFLTPLIFLVTALMVEYSPFFTDIENPKVGLLQAARELGVAIVAYAPLGRGLLTGQYKSRVSRPTALLSTILPS
jgi:aryl-alcohol dehydrogenase-like predicted oxidoreductase